MSLRGIMVRYIDYLAPLGPEDPGPTVLIAGDMKALITLAKAVEKVLPALMQEHEPEPTEGVSPADIGQTLACIKCEVYWPCDVGELAAAFEALELRPDPTVPDA